MKKISVLWCPVVGEPSIEQVENNLDTMQSMVDGYIECVPLRNDIDLICNEEGVIRCMPFNKNPYPEIFGYSDMTICGSYFLCSHDSSGDFKSIPAKELRRLLLMGKMLMKMRGDL